MIENILLDDALNGKICDFGFARMKKTSKRMSICGTDEFKAPEMYLEDDYDEKVDVFSLGMVMAELLCRRVPSEEFLHRTPQTFFKVDIDAFREACKVC